ncbi:hypothetical protein CCFV1_ORF089 [Cotesia congregata filamentous virus 1]|uniref:Uncharacterized protein n=1 Tax=Cotesia congregata filamentous virus 1 TaxID=3064291 RepID=A0ABC8QS75_9VIRU|nr:hypothetical protein CCFV1_ORF089 [Cotesia congregata filamentous virus 1]
MYFFKLLPVSIFLVAVSPLPNHGFMNNTTNISIKNDTVTEPHIQPQPIKLTATLKLPAPPVTQVTTDPPVTRATTPQTTDPVTETTLPPTTDPVTQTTLPLTTDRVTQSTTDPLTESTTPSVTTDPLTDSKINKQFVEALSIRLRSLETYAYIIQPIVGLLLLLVALISIGYVLIKDCY